MSELKEALVPDDEALRIASEVAEDMNQRLYSILRKNVEEGFNLGASLAYDELAIEPIFGLVDDGAIQWMNRHAAGAVKEINDTTRSQLANILTRGAKEGKSVAGLAKDIREQIADWSDIKLGTGKVGRAKLIANTELNEAMSEASLQTYQKLDIPGKSWSTVGDGKVSDGCLENEAAGIIPVKDSFPSGHMRTPRFPGCRCTLVPERELPGEPIPEPVEPVAKPTAAQQAEYRKRMDSYITQTDAEIKKVNDDFMAGKMTLDQNQAKRDAINAALDKQADKVRTEMGFGK